MIAGELEDGFYLNKYGAPLILEVVSKIDDQVVVNVLWILSGRKINVSLEYYDWVNWTLDSESEPL